MLRRTLAATAILALTVGCGGPRPWKVTSQNERRFSQARQACEKLTDDAQQFEKCMKRRGFRREYPGGL